MRSAFIRSFMEMAKSRSDLFLVSGDAGFGVLDEFREKYPDRFLNAGVAEANMIGLSAGLSMTGSKVFVYNIIPFLLYRCYEQVRNDICYQRLGVTLIGIGSGLTYAPSGMTHYAVEDIALASTLPNLSVISPADPIETEAAVKYAAGRDAPVYIRIAKSGEPTIRDNMPVDITRPAVIREGEKVAILSHGSVFGEVQKAAAILSDMGMTPRIVSVPMLRPFPEERVQRLLEDVRAAVVVEEHFRSGGLFSSVAELVAVKLKNVQLVCHALPDKFIHDVFNQTGMRENYGIDAAAIIRSVQELWGRI